MYWDEKVFERMYKSQSSKNFSMVVNTKYGRFYFYFRKQDKNEINGNIVFFPSFPSFSRFFMS